MNTQFSQEQFLAFALLYAASMDGAVTPEEETLIIEKTSEEALTAVRTSFDNCDDADCLDTLIHYRPIYLHSATEKANLLSEMRALFQVNARNLPIEKEMLHLLDRLL